MSRAAAFSGAIGISFSAIFVRLAEVSPATASFFRAAFAIPVLWLLWMLVRDRDGRPRSSRLLALASGLLLAADVTVWHHAIADIGAGIATVLANTQAVFVTVVAWFIYRERPSNRSLAFAPLIFAGVVLLSGLGREDAFGDDPVRGAVLGVVAGMLYAAFLLAFRASNRRYLAPTSGALLDATVGMAIGTLAVGLIESDFTFSPGWPAIGWLIALALVAQVAGWLLISFGLPRLPAFETSLALLVQPVGAILWAHLIFDEFLSPLQWTGMVLVVAGVALFTAAGTSAGLGHRRKQLAQVPKEARAG